MPTIAHISDLHFGRIDPGPAGGLLRDLHAFGPDLLVVSGDFTQRARSGQYRDAAAYLAQLPQPQLVVPGNHDIPLFDIVRRFLFPLHRYRQYISRNLMPVYGGGGLWVAGLNSARSFTLTWNGFWKDGWLSPEQFQELSQLNPHASPTPFRILVTHHPFLPPPGQRRRGVIHHPQAALAQLEACEIDLVLAGHLHQGYSGEMRTHHEAMRRSVLSVQAGTATSTRRRGEPNAYNRLTIEPLIPRVTVQVRRWNGATFEDGDRVVYHRPGAEWQVAGAWLTPDSTAGAVTPVP
jgi:3',5'-cyclic AMP phosphodiesterase CpdA